MVDAETSTIVDVRYLLIVRHGKRDKAHNCERSETRLCNRDKEPTAIGDYQVADRSVDGWPRAQSLAGWVAEFLVLRGIKVSHLIYSTAKDAVDTKDAFLTALQPQGLVAATPEDLPTEGMVTNFGPAQFSSETVHSLSPNLNFTCSESVAQGNTAAMIVGHQPNIGLFIKKQTGVSCPLGLSESALIELGKDPRLLWVIGDEDSGLVTSIKDKIKVKNTTLQFFAGFIVVLIGFSFVAVGSKDAMEVMLRPTWMYLSLAFNVLSLALTTIAIFAFDVLLMPSRYWSEGPSGSSPGLLLRLRRFVFGTDLERPPSPIHWVLFRNIGVIWKGAFLPAVVFLFLGLFLAVGALLENLVAYSILAVLSAVFLYVVWRVLAPRLGVED